MAKQKNFLRHQKSKKTDMVPETSDEFLAVGVEKEEAGEKWRAGDAAKSSRFFLRAIETYDSGLQKYPQDFDLAYNKARLQYELSQQPRLLEHLPISFLELLQAALASHRDALNLKQDDADTLFNLGQVLTSIGETLIENTATINAADGKSNAVPLLQEAVDTFEKCLNIQQLRLQETLSPTNSDPSSQPSIFDYQATAESASSPAQSEEQEQWASVVEPLTSGDVLETCLAEAHALSTLLPLLSPDPSTYQTLSAHSEALFTKALAITSPSPSQEPEPEPSDLSPQFLVAHAKFNLSAPLADFAFRLQLIDPLAYLSTITNVFKASTPSLDGYGPAQADYADALITFNSTLSFIPSQPVESPSPSIAPLSLRWKALSTTLTALASANSSPGPASRTAINGRRGDVELLRCRLANEGYEPAQKSRVQMLKNAETYYEGAGKLANVDGDVKGAEGWKGRAEVCRALRAEVERDSEREANSLEGLIGVVEELRAEGLIV